MTTIAGGFLPGAKGRLLPPSIPFRFFLGAVVFHVALWVLLALAGDGAPGFVGGPGPVLAALHLLTLGVLAMTAMGAAFQLLPVATRRPLEAVWPCRLAFWLFAPGVLGLVHGMATGSSGIMTAAGGAVVAGLAIFGVLTADNLRRARDLPLVGVYGWVAVLSLAALAVLGLGLAADFGSGFLAGDGLPDHGAVARAHLILAAYGFMGMLAVGFSHILVPMFALGPAPSDAAARWAFRLATTALVVGAAGALADRAFPVGLAAALIGLVAAGLHLRGMATTLARGMRKRLGLSFVLIRAAWGLLPASLALGAAAAVSDAPRLATLFGFTLLFGWLLTFLLGILQRIMPFLAAMHGAKSGGAPPLLSELTNTWALRVHAVCHFAALALVAAGIALDLGSAVRIGAGVGVVGALAFAVFAFSVVRRMSWRSPAVPAGRRPRGAAGTEATGREAATPAGRAGLDRGAKK